ncbi:MAG TPA: AGE family epimerase/isomerase [Candidatus Limnocylindria bacterium]|nr:AGE family epimerase/isomerase [Candidatus Limnocylindria bacterium]
MAEEWRSRLAAHLRDGLSRNVIAPWFPRSIDKRDGGFTCGFDRRWQPMGPQDRLLEFQARQTRTAARLGVALPADSAWADTARHGVRYLDRVMRDAVDGGWFTLVSRGGQPLLGGTKHAHGTAYLISAGVEAHRLTGDELPLIIAREAFEWLEATLHDDVYGGYSAWATRQGKVIRSRSDLPPDLAARHEDHLGHPIGLKDANVHSDMLMALTLLAGAWPARRVTQRLAEVFDLLVGRFATGGGAVHYLVEPDFRPVPGIERYGYPLQTGHRLAAAAEILHRSVDEAKAVAKLMLDHALALGWDEGRGGFIEGGPAAEPRAVAGTRLSVRNRPWWVQTEGAELLLQVALDEPSPGRYHALFERLMELIDTDYVDRRNGGWEITARSDWPARMRLSGRGMPKSDMWKDASHEAEMYLAAIRLLRGLARDAPIDLPTD